jgi:hypothetical protein
VAVRKKSYRKQIKSLEQQSEIHEAKIAEEKKKPRPDEGLIRHWEAEIRGFKKGLEKAKKRLWRGR